MNVKCDSCKYAQRDNKTSVRYWTAYMCTNHDSEYYGSLLNTTQGGFRLNLITWKGCAKGKYDNAAALRMIRIKDIEGLVVHL